MSQGGVDNNLDRNVTTETLTPAWAKLWDLINQILRGKINVVADSTFTLTAGATTSTLTDERIGPKTLIKFMPTTSAAATAAGTIYVTNRLRGSATVNHASAAATTQTFVVGFLG